MNLVVDICYENMARKMASDDTVQDGDAVNGMAYHALLLTRVGSLNDHKIVDRVTYKYSGYHSESGREILFI